MASPPRLARALLARLLPDGALGRSIAGDLFEEFDARGGGWRAAVWYWHQALAVGVRYRARHAVRRGREKPMSDLRGDLRTALRMIVRNRGTSSIIVATLAVSIGAASIGFAFADFALFRGLPVDDPSRVVAAFTADTRGNNPRGLVSAPDFLDYRVRTSTLQRVSAYRPGRVPLIRGGQPRTLDAGMVTADFFAAMGQPAIAGRVFAPGDDDEAAPRVALLAHRYWQEAWSARPDAVGGELQIGREIYTIVGVVTPEMEFGNLADYDVWLPMRLNPGMPRDVRDLRVVARLGDDASFAAAAAELEAIGQALAAEHLATNQGLNARLVPVRDLTGGEGFWVVVALFLLSIAFLMLIATSNVANLVMVRAIGRQKELAIRAALGAKRSRLVRQLLVEGLMLSIVAAILAVPVAIFGLELIASIEPAFSQIRVDEHEGAFVAALALICPLIFTLAPAGAIARGDVRHVLAASGTRGTTALPRGRSVLVIAQITLAVVLLSVSSLAQRSVRQAWNEPLGIQADRIVLFTMEFAEVFYPDPHGASEAARAVGDGVAALPGVEAAAAISAVPVLGNERGSIFAIDGVAPNPGEAQPTAVVAETTTDGATALGLPIVAGEWWGADADARPPDVAVVSVHMAERYLGGAVRAIGRRLVVGSAERAKTVRVVGVSGDVRSGDLERDAPPRIWMPLDPSTRRMTFLVKTRSNPEALAPAIRAVAAATAPVVPIEDLATFPDAIARAQSSDVVVVGMLAAFALLSIGLAATGLFGVISHTALQRTPEFGTRLALGARGRDLVRLVMRDTARLVAFGLGIGLLGGVGVGYTMRGLLYRTQPADPLTMAGVAALLIVVALVATLLPAMRAARLDAVEAMRAE
jgi:putative ABC transport system permease protein